MAIRGISVRKKVVIFVSTTMACPVLSTRLDVETNTAVNKTMSLGRLFCET